MSTIGELVKEYCPNGVRFRSLGETVRILDSQRKPITRGKREAGPYPYYGANGIQDWVSGYLFDGAFLLLGEDGSVINRDGSPVLTWAEGKIWVNNHAHVLAEKEETALLRYVYFYLQTHDVTSLVRGVPPKLNQANLKSIRIPVPPLEVQREIVRTLNLFTGLEAELEAELEARRLQYAHYRNSFLTFPEGGVRWIPMGEVLDMRAGRSIRAGDISAVENQRHSVVCYGGNGIRGYVADSSHEGAFVLIGRQGALCGNVKRAHGRLYATEHAVVVRPDSTMNVDFVFHMLDFMNLNQYATKSAQPGLAVGALEKIPIPVPPLDEQKRIAAILDSIDALINDLSIGLPAELAARRKQYAFYRDRLLTFEEAVA